MFVRIKSNPNSPRKSVQIVESRRVGTRVSQVVVRYIGVAKSEGELKELIFLADRIRRELEAQRTEMIPLFGPEELARPPRHKQKRALQIKSPERVRLSDLKEEARVVEGIHDVFGKLFRELGFHQILNSTKLGHILEDCVLAKVAQPSDQHRTSALLEHDFAVSIPMDHIRQMMEGLSESGDRVLHLVREATSNLFDGAIHIAYVFLLSLPFEEYFSVNGVGLGVDDIRRAHSERRVLALTMTDQGLPLGVHWLHLGRSAGALIDHLNTWKDAGIQRFVLITDRANIGNDKRVLGNVDIDCIVKGSKNNPPTLDCTALLQQFQVFHESFSIKQHDLVMGPITHGKQKYVEAHVLICYMALALLEQARYRISLQQQAMNVDQIRNELLRIQASIIKDKTTGARYRIPSEMSLAATKIYRVFHLKRSMLPSPIPS